MVKTTSLSAGAVIHALLKNNENVKDLSNKIYPIITDEATLPYIVYRRSSFTQDVHKGPYGADAVEIEITCLTATYSESINLAEAVRSALDGLSNKEVDGTILRGCTLVDSEELWADDAYIQKLIFQVRI